MSELQKTSRAVVWSFAQGWSGQLIGLAVFVVLAWHLSAEAFGLVAMAMVFIAFTQLFVEQGLSSAIIQHPDPTKEHLSTAFWTNFLAGTTLTIFAYLFSGVIAELFKQPNLEEVVKWLSLALFLNSLVSVQVAIFKKAMNFKSIAMTSIISSILSGLIGVVLAINGFGVWSLVGQQLSKGVFRIVLLWAQSDWRPMFFWSYTQFRELFSYSVNVIGINLFEFSNRYADNLLIGLYLGPTALGYYALAYKFYRTLLKLVGGLANQVAFSSFSISQKDILKVRNSFYTSTQTMAFIAFPIFMVIGVLAPEFFTLLLGEKWENSVLIFQILIVVALIECVLFFNGSLMMALGKPNWRLRLNMLNAAVNIIGFYIVVRWGIEFVALAYVVRTYLLCPIALHCVKLLVDIKYSEYVKGLLGPFLCAASVSIVAVLIQFVLGNRIPELFTILITASLCMALYLLFSYLFMKKHLDLLWSSAIAVVAR